VVLALGGGPGETWMVNGWKGKEGTGSKFLTALRSWRNRKNSNIAKYFAVLRESAKQEHWGGGGGKRG